MVSQASSGDRLDAWSQEDLAASWLTHFRQEMQFGVEAERHRQQSQQPKRRGRPKQPLVTGYVIGDDPTMSKSKGRKMAGLGKHHSTTEDKRITGHSLVQGLSVLLGRSCPLAPQLYRQEAVCTTEDMTFQSKIEQMETLISMFEPVAGTVTHILLDSWYCAKRLRRAARERDFLITTGLKSNRWLRVADETVEQGWRGPQLSDSVAGLFATAILRFWTLAMLAYVFLEQEQHRLQVQWQRPVTIGEARREIQRRLRRNVLQWLHDQFLSGAQPETLFDLFAARGGFTKKCKDRAYPTFRSFG